MSRVGQRASLTGALCPCVPNQRMKTADIVVSRCLRRVNAVIRRAKTRHKAGFAIPH
jgi:hypothetical protein